MQASFLNEASGMEYNDNARMVVVE